MSCNYTCISCSVIFNDAELQRAHYKTDWHRYNLKRKVAELPPVTHGEFQVKVEVQKQRNEARVQDCTTHCKSCNKTFGSTSTYGNHLKSKRHKEKLEIAEKSEKTEGKEKPKKSVKAKFKPKPGVLPPVQDDEMDNDNSDEWEDVDEEDEVEVVSDDDIMEEDKTEALPQTFCLFCPHESVSVLDNFRHMTKSHSFFVPDLQYVMDLEALFVYLGAKVGDGKVCLFCNSSSKQYLTVRAVQKHMTDKGHCMLDYEGNAMLEYADFYDFSTSYPDNEQIEDSENEVSSSDNVLTVDPNTMELILPSGARAGHRALRRYYIQNAPLEPLQNKHRPMISWTDNQCNALGLNERTLSVAMRKRIIARRVENKQRAQNRMALGVKANKLQTHFRLQNMYCG